MNDCLPEGYYSGSVGTDQRPRLPHQHWEETWNQANASFGVMNTFKINDLSPVDCVTHFLSEDIGIPPTYTTRKKKTDPRFKRVISTEYRRENDEEVEKFASVQKTEHAIDSHLNEDKPADERVPSYLKPPTETTFFTESNLKKFKIVESEQTELSEDVTDRPVDSRRNSRIENLKQFEKRKSDFPANLKRSASDCTLNKKKAFLEELEEEICEKIRAYPSATRLSKVQNWMREYKVFPEKRRSVITVIGQTQTKPFSKILNEINQRRKLAKELDKHALCETIVETAHNQISDAKNLVAKVDLVLPDGKVIYSTEKVYLRKDGKFADAANPQKSMEILDVNDRRKKRTEMIPERDSLTSQTGKKIRTKRLNKKLVSSSNPDTVDKKGDVKILYKSATSVVFLSVLAFVSVVLCLRAFFYSFKPHQTYSIVDFFKPKTTAWYEKLLF